MTTKAFTLMTIKKLRLVCVPCLDDRGIAVIDQDGFHYGSYHSRESFKAFVTEHGGVEACRIGIARLEITRREPLPKPDLTTPAA